MKLFKFYMYEAEVESKWGWEKFRNDFINIYCNGTHLDNFLENGVQRSLGRFFENDKKIIKIISNFKNNLIESFTKLK